MTGHPLEATFARGRHRSYAGCDLGVTLGAPSWQPASELFENAGLLSSRLERVAAEVGTDRADVAASLLLEAYAWRVSGGRDTLSRGPITTTMAFVAGASSSVRRSSTGSTSRRPAASSASWRRSP